MGHFNWLQRLASVILIVVVMSSQRVSDSFNEYSVTNYILYRADGSSRKGRVYESFESRDQDPLEGNTVILVHGEDQSPEAELIQELKDALIEERQVNVFLVNWTKTVKGDIRMSRELLGRLHYIAENIKDFIVNITSEALVHEEELHCIGFSFGAHICGETGYLLRYGSSTTLPRISGLDPSLFKFTSEPLRRLSPGDASFVDVIHTSPHHTSRERMGNVDFYPNVLPGMGSRQPGCTDEYHPFKFKLERLVCDHERALELYISSVNRKCDFTSEPCTKRIISDAYDLICFPDSEDYGKMGYDSPLAPGRGMQGLTTTDKEPFC